MDIKPDEIAKILGQVNNNNDTSKS
jgi:hypothetical protein